MSLQWNGIDRRKSLRAEAEAMVSSFSLGDKTANPSEMLMHELLVHKIELEMQNEELRKAHVTLEEARDRYVDLYEFAPIAYITINREGLIRDINLTGAALLGLDRTKLISRRFSTFVAEPDKDRWHRLFMHIMEVTNDEKQKVGLELRRADGSVFYGHFDCLRRDLPDMPSTLRVALTDISQYKDLPKQFE
jgi:PAS domain S-box-containing protein